MTPAVLTAPLARIKFFSQGMLTAEREPTEYMTISLTPALMGDPF
jgi:hypothetical protein